MAPTAPSSTASRKSTTTTLLNSSSAFASSSLPSFRTPTTTITSRTTAASLFTPPPPPSSSHSVKFQFHHPSRSISSRKEPRLNSTESLPSPATTSSTTTTATKRRMYCMCSPTTHPGSFRCSLHKNATTSQPSFSPSNRLNARRSAMTNSLVRIGTVEGDLVKRALAALIRPSSHQQRRQEAFNPRRSRLSVMSRAEDQ